MQTDTQLRQPPRPCSCVAGGRTANHQAGGRENACDVSPFDAFVDFRRQAEIVGRDDQSLQWAPSCRSRRKRKNSIPSRSRRFIISGLCTISPTIDAIFPLRK